MGTYSGPQSLRTSAALLSLRHRHPDPTRMRTFPMGYHQAGRTAALDYLREQPAVSKVGRAQGGGKDSMRK